MSMNAKELILGWAGPGRAWPSGPWGEKDGPGLPMRPMGRADSLLLVE